MKKVCLCLAFVLAAVCILCSCSDLPAPSTSETVNPSVDVTLKKWEDCGASIDKAEEISGIPSSWPGYTLEQGSQGPKVRQIQEQLNVIAGAYPEIPKLEEDGIYGPETEAAVRKFQSIFGLPVTGEIDYKTWYKISEIYVGVSRIAELS